MIAALTATLFLILYAASLGVASVLTWRFAASPWRWMPGGFTVAYYVLLAFYPHPALSALLAGAEYPVGDTLRSGASVAALVTSLYLLAKRHT